MQMKYIIEWDHQDKCWNLFTPDDLETPVIKDANVDFENCNVRFQPWPEGGGVAIVEGTPKTGLLDPK
tara:strand:+ start:2255 stop:2458 length:204 start_codon:yes stop_codon:yes gene_type:complete